jgi:hypothetical protein
MTGEKVIRVLKRRGSVSLGSGSLLSTETEMRPDWMESSPRLESQGHEVSQVRRG